MAVADKSIDPRIIGSARTEFLQHGFEGASLKDICVAAGVTTGALYKRYQGKDDLFSAVVAETIQAIDGHVHTRTDMDVSSLTDNQLVDAWDMSGSMLAWFRFLYQYKDGFTLLVKCAEGSSYSNFKHEFVERMTAGTYAYYREAFRRGLAKQDVSESEMHMILSAFWETVYEPFVHEFDWNRLEYHCDLVTRLFNWRAMLGME